jgi:hypothetical protein
MPYLSQKGGEGERPSSCLTQNRYTDKFINVRNKSCNVGSGNCPNNCRYCFLKSLQTKPTFDGYPAIRDIPTVSRMKRYKGVYHECKEDVHWATDNTIDFKRLLYGDMFAKYIQSAAVKRGRDLHFGGQTSSIVYMDSFDKYDTPNCTFWTTYVNTIMESLQDMPAKIRTKVECQNRYRFSNAAYVMLNDTDTSWFRYWDLIDIMADDMRGIKNKGMCLALKVLRVNNRVKSDVEKSVWETSHVRLNMLGQRGSYSLYSDKQSADMLAYAMSRFYRTGFYNIGLCSTYDDIIDNMKRRRLIGQSTINAMEKGDLREDREPWAWKDMYKMVGNDLGEL